MLPTDTCRKGIIPLPEGGLPWRGTLEPPVAIEAVELPEGEDAWDALGQEKPDWLAAFEDEQARKAARRKR